MLLVARLDPTPAQAGALAALGDAWQGAASAVRRVGRKGGAAGDLSDRVLFFRCLETEPRTRGLPEPLLRAAVAWTGADLRRHQPPSGPRRSAREAGVVDGIVGLGAPHLPLDVVPEATEATGASGGPPWVRVPVVVPGATGGPGAPARGEGGGGLGLSWTGIPLALGPHPAHPGLRARVTPALPALRPFAGQRRGALWLAPPSAVRPSQGWVLAVEVALADQGEGFPPLPAPQSLSHVRTTTDAALLRGELRHLRDVLAAGLGVEDAQAYAAYTARIAAGAPGDPAAQAQHRAARAGAGAGPVARGPDLPGRRGGALSGRAGRAGHGARGYGRDTKKPRRQA